MFSTAPPAFYGPQDTLGSINKWLKTTSKSSILICAGLTVRSAAFINCSKLSKTKMTK